MNAELYFANPDRLSAALPYRAIAGGRRLAQFRDPPVNTRFHEHCFILTLAGAGRIDLPEASHEVGTGDLAWLDTSRAYAHSAASGSDGWAYIWFSMEGPTLDGLMEQLDARTRPIFAEVGAVAGHCLDAVVFELAHASSLANAEIAAQAGRLLAALTSHRMASGRGFGQESGRDPSSLIGQIRQAIAEPWPVPRMAETMGISVSQFHRLFRRHFAISPAEWLRRERYELARRQLSASQDAIAVIAARVGYDDPFHFSRDFRRLAGESPSAFRKARRQQAHG